MRCPRRETLHLRVLFDRQVWREVPLAFRVAAEAQDLCVDLHARELVADGDVED